jgi:hypothetical protein
VLGETEKLGRLLSEGHVQLSSCIDLALKHLPNTRRPLIVLDQFEELFTLTHDRDLRCGFVKQVLDALAGSKLTVVLTLRADFSGQAIDLDGRLSDLIEAGIILLRPMDRQELRLAIERPAGKVGLRFEAGLVERILADVGREPGNLPLLEFALTELWHLRRAGQLTHIGYDQIGGVTGAIARTAEAEFDKLPPGVQSVVLPTLARLVRVATAGEEGTDTRQIVRLNELENDAQMAVQWFARARLLVLGQGEGSEETTVQLAHEGLLRGWGRLKDWIDKDRVFLLWLQRLRVFMTEWQRTGDLLRGGSLAEARRYLGARGRDLNSSERDFIRLSAAADTKSQWSKRIAIAALVLIVVSGLGAFAVTRTDWYQRWQSQSAVSRLGLAKQPSDARVWLQALAASGQGDKAVAAVRGISDQEIRAQLLAAVANVMARLGDFARAATLAGNAADDLARLGSSTYEFGFAADWFALRRHTSAPAAVAQALVESRNLGRARELAEQLTRYPSAQAPVLLSAGTALLRHGNFAEAASFVALARAAAERTKDPILLADASILLSRGGSCV